MCKTAEIENKVSSVKIYSVSIHCTREELNDLKRRCAESRIITYIVEQIEQQMNREEKTE